MKRLIKYNTWIIDESVWLDNRNEYAVVTPSYKCVFETQRQTFSFSNNCHVNFCYEKIPDILWLNIIGAKIYQITLSRLTKVSLDKGRENIGNTEANLIKPFMKITFWEIYDSVTREHIRLHQIFWCFLSGYCFFCTSGVNFLF